MEKDMTHISGDTLTALAGIATKAGEILGEALSNLIDKLIPTEDGEK